jgi:hypothetical protein
VGKLIDSGAWATDELAARWAEATPFSHVVIDDLVAADWRRALLEAVADEPAELIRDPIFETHSTFPGRFEAPVLADFAADMRDPELLARVGAITGKQVGAVDVRAFAYHPGQYLLPHTDLHGELDRLVAYAYYLDAPEPIEGGELDLFACAMDDGDITGTSVAATYPPQANRLILFDVGPHTLHQVREVTAGIRLSLTGWFYP